MPADNPNMKTVYHVNDGAVSMYPTDAMSAVQRFPDEWRFMPWHPDEAGPAREKLKERHAREVEEAMAAGRPLPAPLSPAPPQPTSAEQAEIDVDTKARAEAAELIKAHDEKEAKLREEAAKLAAARGLLETVPPQPDPNARRRGISPAELPSADRGTVDVSDDWRNLSDPKRRALAMRLGAPSTVKVVEADEVIDAEVRRRGPRMTPQPTPEPQQPTRHPLAGEASSPAPRPAPRPDPRPDPQPDPPRQHDPGIVRTPG